QCDGRRNSELNLRQSCASGPTGDDPETISCTRIAQAFSAYVFFAQCLSPSPSLGLSVKHASRRKPLNIARAHLYAAATALNSHTKTHLWIIALNKGDSITVQKFHTFPRLRIGELAGEL